MQTKISGEASVSNVGSYKVLLTLLRKQASGEFVEKGEMVKERRRGDVLI